MSKTHRFDKTGATLLGAEVESALADFCAARGLTVEMTQATAKPGLFAIAFAFHSADDARTEWTRMCGAFHLKPEWFGGSFMFRRKAFTIVGIDTGRMVAPVIAKRAADGKLYRMTADVVRNARIVPRASTPVS